MMTADSISRISDNLAAVKDRIGIAAKKSGRSAADIQLVAVTKYVDAETTRALVAAGQTTLGESRPQVLWEKAASLSDLDIQWHLIGHLQRNKVKRSIPYCHLIHSVDSLRLLQAIESASRELELVTDCLLEVNISGESAKHGLQPAELETILTAARELESVRVCGLMGMAGLMGDAETNRKEFASLRSLMEQNRGLDDGNVELAELSMGMSRDFEAAIEEGATIVRIGSVLFDGV